VSEPKPDSKKPIVIKADDAAIRHKCGAMVSPSFNISGKEVKCPRCHQAV
jgi:hypothetical protein